MSEIIDRWVEKLKNIPPIGTLTHTERLRRAFALEEPDLVPVVPELELYSILYAGYNFYEVWEDYEKATDAVLRTWVDFRTDGIFAYSDPSTTLDSFLTPEQRKTNYNLRDGKSFVVFKEITHDLDRAIALLEEKPWEKYGRGRATTHFLPHLNQLLEFHEKMEFQVPVILTQGTPSNRAEMLVGVQNFIKWAITDKKKLHRYMELVTDYQIERLNSLKPYAEKGALFFSVVSGARTWGPRQFEEFGIYDTIFNNQAAKMFDYTYHHFCGNNVPYAMARLTAMSTDGVQYDVPMDQLGWNWAKWCEWVARLFHGKLMAMNAPTTQDACYRTPAEIAEIVKSFIDHTTPFTTATIMPGCQLSVATPKENVHALVDAGRKYGVYPECKTRIKPVWTEDEYQESLAKLTPKLPVWAYAWRKMP
jgi:uroporphyrinogen-III decarboxylase